MDWRPGDPRDKDPRSKNHKNNRAAATAQKGNKTVPDSIEKNNENTTEAVEAAASKWAARASKTPHVETDNAVAKVRPKRIEYGKIPGKDWCWARPGYLADGGIFQMLKSTDDNGDEVEYLIDESVWSQSDDLRRQLSPNAFRLALFYIPSKRKHRVVRVPVPRSEDDSYGHSATAVYEAACEWFIKPVWSGGEYVISDASDAAVAKNPAAWPDDKSDDEILDEALKGRYITTIDHPVVVKAVRGE